MDVNMEVKDYVIRKKIVVLESSDSHRVWLEVVSTGEVAIHESFGDSTVPDTEEKLRAGSNSLYHVMMAIKSKYLPMLRDILADPDLLTFTDGNSSVVGVLGKK